MHLAACVVWSAGELFLAAAILPRIGPTFIPADLSLGLRYLLWNSLSSNCLLYWEILAVQAAFRYHRRYQDRERRTAELEAQLARAQLSTLKMQLQPHFLFNTLNAIMVLVRQKKAPQAEEVLGRFSDLLRSLLDDENAQEVPLRRELEYLRLYLSIEEVRF
ncbi:MAG: histidine kinase, partial [Acidobacteriia bacterium]|nr:histidine kinase [Terriglobia bacterium]